MNSSSTVLSPNSIVVSVFVALLLMIATLTQNGVHTVEAFTLMVGNHQSPLRRQISVTQYYMSSISASSNEQEQEQLHLLRRDVATDTTTTTTTTLSTTGSTEVTTFATKTNNVESNTNMKNLIRNRWMELPASSLSSSLRNRQEEEQLKALEQMIGRIAIVGAFGIVMQECSGGQSILEQVRSMII